MRKVSVCASWKGGRGKHQKYVHTIMGEEVLKSQKMYKHTTYTSPNPSPPLKAFPSIVRLVLQISRGYYFVLCMRLGSKKPPYKRALVYSFLREREREQESKGWKTILRIREISSIYDLKWTYYSRTVAA